MTPESPPTCYCLRILTKVGIPFLSKCHLGSRGKQLVLFRASVKLVPALKFTGVTGPAN